MLSGAQLTLQLNNITTLQDYNIKAPERRDIRSSAHIAKLQHYNIITLQTSNDVLSGVQPTLQQYNISS